MKTEHASYVKKGNKITALGSSRDAVLNFLELDFPGIRQAKGLFREKSSKNRFELRIVLV